MLPNIYFIKYLINNSFIRNECIYNFLDDNNNIIDLSRYICYTKGLINDIIVIQSFQILETYITGIQSYKIKWWDTFCVDSIEEIKEMRGRNIGIE